MATGQVGLPDGQANDWRFSKAQTDAALAGKATDPILSGFAKLGPQTPFRIAMLMELLKGFEMMRRSAVYPLGR